MGWIWHYQHRVPHAEGCGRSSLQVWKVIAFLLKFSAPKVLLRAQQGHNPERAAVSSPSPPLYVWLIDVSPSWCFPSFGEDLIPNTLLFPVLDPPYMHSPNSPGTLHTLNQIYNEMLSCATTEKEPIVPLKYIEYGLGIL